MVFQICLEALEREASDTSAVQTILEVLDRLLQAGLLCQEESLIHSLLHGLECMSSTEATIELAISVLEGVIRSLSAPGELRSRVVQQMFDEVYKGAQYEQVVNRAMNLWDDFKQDRID